MLYLIRLQWCWWQCYVDNFKMTTVSNRSPYWWHFHDPKVVTNINRMRQQQLVVNKVAVFTVYLTDFGIPIDSFVTTILIFQTFQFGLQYLTMENFSLWMPKKKCKAETWKPRPIIYLEQIHMKEWAHLTADVVRDHPASPEKETSFGNFKTFGNLTIWNMKISQMFFE